VTYTAATWLYFRDSCSNGGCTISDFQISGAGGASVGCSGSPNSEDCNAATTYPIDFIYPTTPVTGETMVAYTGGSGGSGTGYAGSGCGKNDLESDHGAVDLIVGGLQTSYPVGASSGCGYASASGTTR